MRYFKGINRRTMSTGSRWGLPWVRMRVGVIGKDSGGWNVLELCALLCKYTQSYRTQTSFTTNAKLGLNKLLRKTLRGNKSPWLQAAEVTSPERVYPEFCVYHLLFFPCCSIQYVGLVYILLTFTCMFQAACIFLPLTFLGEFTVCCCMVGFYLFEIPHSIYSFSCQWAFGSLSLFVRFAFTNLLLRTF